jgi:hypothetical protein
VQAKVNLVGADPAFVDLFAGEAGRAETIDGFLLDRAPPRTTAPSRARGRGSCGGESEIGGGEQTM